MTIAVAVLLGFALGASIFGPLAYWYGRNRSQRHDTSPSTDAVMRVLRRWDRRADRIHDMTGQGRR